MPKKKYRDTFASQIDVLVQKMQSKLMKGKKTEQINIEQELKIILKKVEIKDEDSINECITLLKKRELE